MLVVTSGGLLVNAAGLWVLRGGHDANLNMRLRRLNFLGKKTLAERLIGD